MLFQDAPPDTSRYMIAGYAIFFAISAIYLLSLIVRRRNLEQDLKTLESIESESGRAQARTRLAAPSGGRMRGSRQAPSQRKRPKKKAARRR